MTLITSIKSEIFEDFKPMEPFLTGLPSQLEYETEQKLEVTKAAERTEQELTEYLSREVALRGVLSNQENSERASIKEFYTQCQQANANFTKEKESIDTYAMLRMEKIEEKHRKSTESDEAKGFLSLKKSQAIQASLLQCSTQKESSSSDAKSPTSINLLDIDDQDGNEKCKSCTIS